MTPIEIPEAALQAAMSAYANVNAECGEPVEYFPEAMEAALAAAVSVMFESAGFQRLDSFKSWEMTGSPDLWRSHGDPVREVYARPDHSHEGSKR